MPEQNYIALTIGPIYRTLQPLRRSLAIFAGSYLFSYIMRELLHELTDEENKLSGQILIPYVPSSKDALKRHFDKKQGVGLFPDRLLAQAETGDYDRMKLARIKVLEKLTTELKIEKNFVNQYIQVYCISVSLEKGADTINELNRLLDNLELRNQFVNISNLNPDWLTNYLAGKQSTLLKHLLDDAFHTDTPFPSLIEIATRSLQNVDRTEFKSIMDREGEEQTVMANLQREFKTHFRQHHKYVAIVQADGDRMGKQIGNLNADSVKLNAFSQKLHQFGQQAKDIILFYGGSPVYIGGDDLLFFAPVATVDRHGRLNQTIFDCIANLDKAFHAFFSVETGGPTLSYGISISYYKYPLNEAREQGYDLLMHQAKNEETHPNKNALEFKVLKNSGSFFSAGLDKGTTYYEHLSQLLKTQLTDGNWLNSVIYFVQYMEGILPSLSEAEMKNLFRNRLNEGVHVQNGQFLYDQLPSFIFSVYQAFQTPILESDEQKREETQKHRFRQAHRAIFGTLRFIQFIRAKPEED